ncbi:hypothetical protein LSAT2_004158 [Lamellibrachia satsuma]|nr:hypothetical protein LSAT2_004158 [Lamellibrachia satsuma]
MSVPFSHTQKPGGDNQYSVLYEKGFRYDATLLGGTGSLDPHGQPPWPVTLDTLWPNCLTPKCPKNSYPGLWELPITRLANPVNGRPCAYLDACLVSLKTSTDVYKLLYQNFRYNYDSNRAPMIINIQTKTLRSATAVGGIKKFLNKLLSDAHDDTWILTMQDALDWIQSPIPISELGSSDTWACPDRNFHACNMDSDDEESRRKAKNMESPFRSLIFVDSLWIYQIVFLVFAYLVLLRHDSRQNK